MGDLLSGIGDLMFTLVIGYIGAIEFLYVLRHLYHWSCNHDATEAGNDANAMTRLQDRMRDQLATAEALEKTTGNKAMQDGVLYKDGFRIDPNQEEIDRLIKQLKDKSISDAKRKELEKELAKHKKIEQETRKQLEEAEANLARQQRENERKLLEAEQAREREQKKREEEAEAAEAKRKAAEEAQKKRQEEEEEKVRRLAKETQEAKEAEEQRKRTEEEAKRKAQEREKEEQRQREADEENRRKLFEAEQERERQQLKREQEEEEERRKRSEEEEKRKAQEKEEEEQRQREADEENRRKIFEAEQERERQQQQREEEEENERRENEQRILQAERDMEEAQRQTEELADQKIAADISADDNEKELTDNERRLIESIKERELAESDQQDEASAEKEEELLQRILQAREQLSDESEEEPSLRLFNQEQDQERKQRRIEENARLFLEAEKEMADMQEKMLEAVTKREFTMNLESAPHTPVEEELCIKKTMSPLRDQDSPQPMSHRVKTQLAQSSDDSFSISTKSLLFPGISDDASSNEPTSSKQSSFSTQPSDEIATGTDSQCPPQLERQDPDGEDTASGHHYTDDYLRSLDGIKQRPLSREGGSGRRRAFKKRRSSGSSNSSFESRASREEELKMFTSLEEEEMQNHDQSNFTPIRYTSEPSLKVKGHHRRHKRSPAKDMRSSDDSQRSSLERLGEETVNPWGDVVPGNYKESEFWKREKALSIDEEMELEKPTSSEEISYDTATNLPDASSFEEATPTQNEEALTNLRRQDITTIKEEEAKTKDATDDAAKSDNNTNLKALYELEREASPSRSSASPRLRRSPRIEEMNQYEDRFKESKESPASSQGSVLNTPTIQVDKPLDFGPWRDEFGLVMEGLSDFYDFTASVNPSRSRSTSRNPSPANTAPSTPQPKNVAFVMKNNSQEQIDVYDDTNQLEDGEVTRDNIVAFISELNELESQDGIIPAPDPFPISSHLQYVIDDQPKGAGVNSVVPLVNIIDDSIAGASSIPDSENNEDMNSLVASLRSQRCQSRSRSKSPLPTAGNIQRSIENRRHKMIKHNEDVLEKLIVTNMLPNTDMDMEADGASLNQETAEEIDGTLRVEQRSRARSRSQSCSRSSSPLPTAENIERGIEHRRNRRIQDNDEYFKNLTDKMQTPERNSQSQMQMNTPMISIQVTEVDNIDAPDKIKEDDNCSLEQMDTLIQSLRAARSRSRTPTRSIVSESDTSKSSPIYFEITEANSTSIDQSNSDNASRQEMDSLVQSLRVDTPRRTRSKSPMRLPTSENLSKSLDSRRNKLIERNDDIQSMLEERAKTPEPSQLTVEYVYEFVETSEDGNSSTNCSVASGSQSPLCSAVIDHEKSRSKTPSRSMSPSRNCESQDTNFHVMLNLEGSHNKTLLKNSEEYESSLAARQKRVDLEALEKLKNASEEIELRTLSPVGLAQESGDRLGELATTDLRKMIRSSPTTPDYDRTISEEMRDVERIKQEILQSGFKRSTYVGESMDLGSEYEPFRRQAALFQRSKSPSPSITITEAGQMTAADKRKIQDLVLAELTGAGESRSTGAIPKAERLTSTDSDLSLCKEVEDTLRIKEEMLNSGFQRSTYVGESVDASLDFEEMRSQNAEFRRSASKSRSPLSKTQLEELADIDVEATKRARADDQLDELQMAAMNFKDFSRHLNPQFFDTDRRVSDTALLQNHEILTQFKDNNFDLDLEPEEYHHYRRFSLAQEQPMEEYPSDDYIFIEQVEVRTRSGSRTWTREDFYSQDINDFLLKDSNDIVQDSHEVIINAEERKEADERVENEEHQAVETEIKPTLNLSNISFERSPHATHVDSNLQTEKEDEEYKTSDSGDDGSSEAYMDEISLAENGESNGVDDIVDVIDDEEESNGSDDRRTVIEVDDEIDEDFSDFNERAPAEESQHEISECEEAEREMDRYAGRVARDWAEMVNVNDMFSVAGRNASETDDSEGAVGVAGNSPYDSDSFTIDQIYDEAIKNRKQSGILKEFDSILNEMTNSFIENSNKDMDEHYALWSKTQKKAKNVEFNMSFLESERKDTEIRYLGDATVSARQSTRLRSRYGYNPVLQTSTLLDDTEVDINYKPKREYNWRKNFKLDDDGNEYKRGAETVENYTNGQDDVDMNACEITENSSVLDLRKYNLGSESITLFRRSPEKELENEGIVGNEVDTQEKVHDKVEEKQQELTEKPEQEMTEKPKKKKTKKKSRRGSRASIEIEALAREDDADDSCGPPAQSRRSSSIQMDTDSPKKKSRSRRSSRASVTTEDSLGLLSPRSSIGLCEPIGDIMEEYSETKEPTRQKKMKKRKKTKEVKVDVAESPREEVVEIAVSQGEEPTVSAVMTPDSASSNLLSALSPQESVCVTPSSIESESGGASQTTDANAAATTTPSTPLDTFDILKDANFYPLF